MDLRAEERANKGSKRELSEIDVSEWEITCTETCPREGKRSYNPSSATQLPATEKSSRTTKRAKKKERKRLRVVQMAFPVFHEFDVDSTIRTNGLHWEGFPRLAWEALSAAGYTTPLTYEVSEFERLGVPRCRVIVTVLPHPDHTDWFDLSFVYWGFITHETVESATLRVLTDFCDHNPTVVALSLRSGCFPL
jgi:hypothetical protein